MKIFGTKSVRKRTRTTMSIKVHNMYSVNHIPTVLLIFTLSNMRFQNTKRKTGSNKTQTIFKFNYII